MSDRAIIIVGGGLAGLTAAIRICEQGHPVKLFSYVPVKRSHSVTAQGGINASINIKGEGDSPQVHFEETIVGGDFLANQPPAKGMCDDAPNIVYMLDRMGVPFNRTPEGNLDFRGFGGTLYHRTAFSGATTGQQLLYALDEQVRRYEAQGLVEKFEYWSMQGIMKDSAGRCRGITALNMPTMEVRAFQAPAVILALGGSGLVFGMSTNSMINTGSAIMRAFKAGARFGNPEFYQVHPTAIAGMDKRRLISESVRSEGGRVWTYKDGKPWYFFEELYPAYKNLVPRDIASRVIYDVVINQGLGVNGQRYVYLDVSHIDDEVLHRKLGGVLEIYEKFMGEDPYHNPMKVYPAVHYSMGGMWVDYSQMTSMPGLFAAGECDYQYHGANRLGANSLLSCIYAGRVVGKPAVEYSQEILPALTEAEVGEAVHREVGAFENVFTSNGDENAYAIQDEMGELMDNNVTIVRDNKVLDSVASKLRDLEARLPRIGLRDKGRRMNSEAIFVRELRDRMLYAKMIVQAARLRDESRGAHYKPEFPKRDDANWLKTTLADYTPDGIKISYEPVDVSLLPLRERRYDVKH
jgi:succinate dehydrogenase / fumarate reductase, flavoprotein subunit